MSNVSESAFSHRTAAYSEQSMTPHRPKGSRIHLFIAFLGMGSLGFMLWTIAQMLKVIPG